MTEIAGSMKKSIVLLAEPSDHKDFYEVISIKDTGKNPFVIVQGIEDAPFLVVSSWIHKSELSDLIQKNRDIKFITGVRVHGE